MNTNNSGFLADSFLANSPESKFIPCAGTMCTVNISLGTMANFSWNCLHFTATFQSNDLPTRERHTISFNCLAPITTATLMKQMSVNTALVYLHKNYLTVCYTHLFSFLFSTVPFCFLFLDFCSMHFYFSVQSPIQSYRSKGFYVMEQNNRQKCILAMRMSSVSGPEMVGQRWQEAFSSAVYKHSLSPPSHSFPSFFCLFSLTHFLFWLLGVVWLSACWDWLSKWVRVDWRGSWRLWDNSASGIDRTIVLSLEW